MTMAGRSMQRLMRAPSFQVSGLHYNDLLFYETKVWDGILGLEFLSRHLVTLDWPNHRLYLKPGKEFDRYDEHDMSGLGLQRLDSKTIVNLASPDQPGYQAGLRDGDELLAINGKSASNYALYDLTDLLRSKDGLKITVKFRRGNVIQTTSFLLRKEI
jgi:predicted metalloprotease with PDZ domain